MPLTPSSGKVDRQVLLKSVPKESKTIDNTPSSLSAIEKIRHATSVILHIPIEKVDVNKSFFHLGGDSISIFLLLKALSDLGIDVKLDHALQVNSLQEMVKKSTDNEYFKNEEQMKVVPFTDLGDNELLSIVDQLTETFEVSDALVRLFKMKGINFKPIFHGLVFKCKKYYPAYGIAVKMDGKIVAAVVNAPLDVEMKINKVEFLDNPDELNKLFDFCLEETIEKLQADNHDIMESLVAYVDQNIPTDVGAKALLMLANETTSIGRSHGHTASVTVDVTAATQILDVEVLGHTITKTVYPHYFCFKNNYPFAEMDPGFKILSVLEYFS